VTTIKVSMTLLNYFDFANIALIFLFNLKLHWSEFMKVTILSSLILSINKGNLWPDPSSEISFFNLVSLIINRII
jgi:hypothetical protein